MAVDKNGKIPDFSIENGAHVSVKAVITPEIQETMNHAIQNEQKVIKI